MMRAVTRSLGGRRRLLKGKIIAVGLVLVASAPAGASAVTPRPHWAVAAVAAPTYFKPGDEGDYYEVIAVNDGAAPTDGSKITVTDTLPAAVASTAIVGDAVTGLHGAGEAMTCPTGVSCEGNAKVPVGELVVVKISVSVSPQAARAVANSVTISGGGADPVTASLSTAVTSDPVPFGASILSSDLAAEDGGLDSQAGSHPAGFTTMLGLNIASVAKEATCPVITISTPGCPLLNADVKDVEVALPPGLVGNPTAVPRCSQAVFQTYGNASCPPDTQVGVMHLFFYGSGTAIQYAPVYNVEPPPGQPAELGFTAAGFVHIPMFFHVRSDGDYGLTAQLDGISEADPIRVAALTIWGVPASATHNSQREGPEGSGCYSSGCPSGVEERPFLTLPTSCSGTPTPLSVSGDSWQIPGTPQSLPVLASTDMPATSGCDALSFAPSITAAPDTLQAGVPAGYTVHLDVPQNEDPAGLAAAHVRDVQITLPQGVMISPSAANGLAACSKQQFQPHSAGAGGCPSQAKIGEVSITTPLLQAPLRGGVFLGTPECSPCTPADARDGRMIPVLLEARGSGVTVKLIGSTSVNQETGQVTTSFSENPQLPFSDLELVLKGGDNAPLVNPATCGSAISVAKLTPWSTMTATETLSPAIPIAGCSSPGFVPSLRAGSTTSAQAAAFSGFSMELTRPDRQQELGAITLRTPPGALGMLSNVTQCGEAAANAGICPSSSQIGTAKTTIGRGAMPLTITGGKVYLTGPYGGKPFGLSIVMPAVAGPFELAGNTGSGTQVIRASIAVDPHTAALAVASDALPRQLDGISLDIRTVSVDIDRVGFMFNPTNCNPMSVGGTVTSASGSVASASFPFQAVNCATLPFKPAFTVITQSKTSKANGASLHVKVTSGPGQANIATVRVSLPKQLPSRLTTLQKACRDATFNANPASCPAGSVVGSATAVTPVLKAALTGPAYLVSHAGAAFPDLVIVLQGEGVTLDLVGTTDIKKGITISTFSSVPDAPIKRFDLVLPAGPHSALGAYLPAAAHGSLCRQPLAMPTRITGQNGAVIRPKTRIAVSGCPRHRATGDGRRRRLRAPRRTAL